MPIRISRAALDAALLPTSLVRVVGEGDDAREVEELVSAVPLAGPLLDTGNAADAVELDAEPGDVAYLREEDGMPVGDVQILGVRDAFMLKAAVMNAEGTTTVPLSPGSLFLARQALAGVGADAWGAERWVETVDQWQAALRGRVEELPEGVRAGVYMTDLMNDQEAVERLPEGITPEDMARAAEAFALRRFITEMEPDSPDAFGRSRLGTVLEAANILDARPLKGGEIPQPPQIKGFIRDAFARMTALPIERMDVLMFQRGDAESIERLRTHLEQGQRRILDGDWTKGVRDQLGARFDRMFPGYNRSLRMDFFAEDGADFLFVNDFAGSYVYSWPTESRRIAAEGDRTHFFLTRDDIPTAEELDRLRDTARRLAGEGMEPGEDHEGRGFGM